MASKIDQLTRKHDKQMEEPLKVISDELKTQQEKDTLAYEE